MRTASVTRKTKETRVAVSFNLDGTRKSTIETGIGFFNHMLELFAFHGNFDLEISCTGDLDVDCHHSVEDTGLALGSAFRKAVGENPAVKRYGMSSIPMDESLSRAVVDISGRSCLAFSASIPGEKVGAMETGTVKEFFKAFVQEARITLHMENVYGENSHHIIESLFKACARALSEAVRPAEGETASTKGIL